MASGASEAELLAQFQSITGADSERAKFFLDSAQGELEIALTAFFDGEPEEEALATESSQISAPSAPVKAKTTSSSYSGGPSNIHSLSTMASDEEDEDGKDSGQAFYAGGSSTSGQQIIGPPKKGQDFVKEMFKRARDQGAEVEEDEGPSPLGGRRNMAMSFGGTGFKLGSDDNDSEVIPSMSKPKEGEREFTLKMWQNGFSLDDGPLRAYDDPANREFLACIMKGRVPLELVREARGGEVNIKMEDHKHEDYVPPKVTVKPFQGAGHVLGSVLPPMEVPSQGTPQDQKNSEEKAAEELKVDESQPTTSLQVRLSNGGRLVVKLNHTHTVGDLRRFITIARPEYASTLFSLLTTFPNKELTKDEDTLKDAELLGAAILLRPKQ